VRGLIEGKDVVIDSIQPSTHGRWEAKVAFRDDVSGEWTDLGETLFAWGLAEVRAPRLASP